MFSVKIIASSISAGAPAIRTVACTYPRFIHGEVMTHRVFSRNAMSSRAIPVRKMIAQVWSNPAMPVHWGANQPGMQAHSQLTGWRLWAAVKVWRGAAKAAACTAWVFDKLGLHKQLANRVLEPWQWMTTLITATEWDNFFELRAHPDAQPEFQKLAYMLKEAFDKDVPTPLKGGDWHLPFVSGKEREALPLHLLLKISTARCARVSYLTHDGREPSVDADLALFERLAGSRPLHASPLEHQATPGKTATGNFTGWKQHRKVWEQQV